MMKQVFTCPMPKLKPHMFMCLWKDQLGAHIRGPAGVSAHEDSRTDQVLEGHLKSKSDKGS